MDHSHPGRVNAVEVVIPGLQRRDEFGPQGTTSASRRQHPKMRNLVRAYINKVPPLSLFLLVFAMSTSVRNVDAIQQAMLNEILAIGRFSGAGSGETS